MLFDIKTMMVILPISSVLIAMLLMLTGAHRSTKSLRAWTLSLLAQGAGWAIAHINGKTLSDDLLLGSIALSLFASGWTLRCTALCRFAGLRPWRRTLIVLSLAPLPCAAIFPSDSVSRVACADIVYGTLSLSCAFLLWRTADFGARSLRRGVLVLFTSLGIVLLLRAGELFMRQPLGSPLAFRTALEQLAFLGSYLTTVGASFGFVLMHRTRMEEELHLLATTDPLTGLLNRRSFILRAHHELTQRHHHPLALLMLDLDHFKQINDLHGHPTGDEVLCDFVQTMKSCLRKIDLVARFGGEEFVILLANTDTDAALIIAERIRCAVAARQMERLDLRYTVSIGIASTEQLTIGSADTIDALLAHADVALYRAKQQGRNRCEVAAVLL